MKVFITGLTGTLGTALAQNHRAKGDEVVGCARSEAKAAEWLSEHSGLAQLHICDAKDIYQRDMLIGIDRLYNCAAMKHVDLCERNAEEAVKQNIDLVTTLAADCEISGVEFVHISTDKACLPTSVYGATKLIAENIALGRGGSVVRLGNLIGSSGSVFHLWRQGHRRITDARMTRFFIPTVEAAEFIVNSTFGFSYPHMKSVCMGEVAAATGEIFEVIGLRDGETLHQSIVEGVCSSEAEKWDIRELLQRAGL